MQIGLAWVPSDLRIYPDIVRAMDAAGFDFLGVPDTQASVYRDAFVAITVAALNSSRLRIAPWVTTPVSRHPAATANALASIHEIAPGRIAAAIGTGDSAAFNLGLRPAKLATLEAFVQAVRALLRGGSAEWEGRQAKLIWPRGGIPLFVGASGPKSLALAGRIADGVVTTLGVTPEALAIVEEGLRSGAAPAGRDAGKMEQWFQLRGGVAERYEDAVEAALPSLAAIMNNVTLSSMDGKALPASMREQLGELRKRYDYTQHNRVGSDNPNGRLVRELGLTDYLLERFGVIGTPRQIVERLRELEARGVQGITLRVLTEDPLHFLRVWREEVAPRLP